MIIDYKYKNKFWNIKDKNSIVFGKPFGKYADLSNLSNHSIDSKFKVWPTVEHFYQANKFIGSSYEEKIRNLRNVHEVLEIGHNRFLPIRTDWEEAKEYVMTEGLVAKFIQYPQLKNLLLSTSGCILVNYDKENDYWGSGFNGYGKNRLGILLMKIRDTMLKDMF